MLDVSRALNPECEHVEGDMRTVRLDRQFDCVFRPRRGVLHDDRRRICAALSRPRSSIAVQVVWLCSPPITFERPFAPTTDHGGNDGESRGLRYLEWVWDPDPADNTYIADYAYMLRTSDGSVRVEHDRHVEGLFARGDWLRLLEAVGFQPRSVPFDHSEVDGTLEVFVGTRPSM